MVIFGLFFALQTGLRSDTSKKTSNFAQSASNHFRNELSDTPSAKGAQGHDAVHPKKVLDPARLKKKKIASFGTIFVIQNLTK